MGKQETELGWKYAYHFFYTFPLPFPWHIKLVHDYEAHKLDQVSFNIPRGAGGREQYLEPWTFTSSDRRFEMAFQPILDRKALTSLGILMSDQHQVFGNAAGIARLDDGSAIELRHFLGFAEKVRNKW